MNGLDKLDVRVTYIGDVDFVFRRSTTLVVEVDDVQNKLAGPELGWIYIKLILKDTKEILVALGEEVALFFALFATKFFVPHNRFDWMHV
jgi:hypothetical protein